MERLAIQMTDYFDGLLKGKRFFSCDKDPLYTQKFKKILENSGIKAQQVPSHICNPYAERFVNSIKDDCLRNSIFYRMECSTRRFRNMKYTITPKDRIRIWITSLYRLRRMNTTKNCVWRERKIRVKSFINRRKTGVWSQKSNGSEAYWTFTIGKPLKIFLVFLLS